MYFYGNLRYLRKRDGVTQEDLAEQICVSRQSVSKWETGEAYPETDKLILLCDFFGVSLDDMLRRNLAEEAPDNTQTADAQYESEKADAYVKHMNRFSKFISSGIFLILFGVGLCVVFGSISLALSGQARKLTEICSAVSVLLFTAGAVFLFVFAGLSHSNFAREHGEISAVFTDEQKKSHDKRFAVTLAGLISGILLDVVLLMIFSYLAENGVLSGADVELSQGLITAAFLIILAFLVAGIVYTGMQHGKYSTDEYNNQVRKSTSADGNSKLKDAICSVIMLAATAVFLLSGFVWNIWHPSWAVFPVGGILCGIVSVVIDAKKQK